MNTLPSDELDKDHIKRVIMNMALERGALKTFCPSEVARHIAGNHPDQWGVLMIPIRRVAVELMKKGELLILRKGEIVDPDHFKGVYRLSYPHQE